MRVKAQVAMVMNLDKCIGCHTCSVTCKNVWTSREGTSTSGGTTSRRSQASATRSYTRTRNAGRAAGALGKNGKLELKAGGKLRKLANIFFNPDLPSIDDYYEPWTYDYETLTNAKLSEHQPVARPISQLSGEAEWTSSGDRTGTTTSAARRRLQPSTRTSGASWRSPCASSTRRSL